MDRRHFALLMPALLAMTDLNPVAGQEVKMPAAGTINDTWGRFRSNWLRGYLGRGRHTELCRSELRTDMLAAFWKTVIFSWACTRQFRKSAPNTNHSMYSRTMRSSSCSGVAMLYINGIEHRLDAGDAGLVCAGDAHWVKNGGDSELVYLVVALGAAK
jgi:hypothetical protein